MVTERCGPVSADNKTTSDKDCYCSKARGAEKNTQTPKKMYISANTIRYAIYKYIFAFVRMRWVGRRNIHKQSPTGVLFVVQLVGRGCAPRYHRGQNSGAALAYCKRVFSLHELLYAKKIRKKYRTKMSGSKLLSSDDDTAIS